MSRKQLKSRAGGMVPVAIVGFFIVVIACGVGFGVASADSTDEHARSGAFGFNDETIQATRVENNRVSDFSFVETETSDQFILEIPDERNISAGLAMIEQKEEEYRAQVEADNKAAIERVKKEKVKQGKSHNASKNTKNEVDEYSLPSVDWSVGRHEFIDEWSNRIDEYLKGTQLSGYGYIFAEAAWRNGVDPRWSPAISNTESGNGAHCFLPHNAWGWGNTGWSDWTSAINAHVEGLAESYGYSITYEAAKKYCPPNTAHWYSNTISQMSLI